ncbi:MAG: GntR family transcriptional regulator [Spirochaetales bacterium]|jgi:GntR family transcriptional regulator|nr:GntR family transcriptional regulator [Spirochaetales bacterium]
MNHFFTNKQLNKEIPVHFYYQLKELLREYITSAPPNSQLPTETKLCELFDISRSTVRQALGELTTEGYLVRHQGKGTMIVPQKIEQEFLEVLESFNDEMQEKGLVPHTRVLSFSIIEPPGSAAAALRLKPGKKAVQLIRVRSINAEPIVLVTTYLPADVNGLGGILEDDLVRGSMYQLMEHKYAIKIDSSRRTLEIRLAGDFEAEHLHIPLKSPLQYIETVSCTEQGIPIEFSKAYYRADKNKFVIEIRKKQI